MAPRLGAFRAGLRELGYVEGQNFAIKSRWADGNYERLPELATELVRLKVDIIVTYGPTATRAAKEATGTIPIVIVAGVDPVTTGYVSSLSRPGGNNGVVGEATGLRFRTRRRFPLDQVNRNPPSRNRRTVLTAGSKSQMYRGQ
jgi:hypothetical protein